MTEEVKPKNKGGRPKVKIDWTMVKNLCAIQCTADEIAATTGISVDTYSTRCQTRMKCSFSEYIKKNSKGGKASLRRSMWKKAVTDENTTMQIWLSKNYLDMSDKQELSSAEDKPFKLAYSKD